MLGWTKSSSVLGKGLVSLAQALTKQGSGAAVGASCAFGQGSCLTTKQGLASLSTLSKQGGFMHTTTPSMSALGVSQTRRYAGAPSTDDMVAHAAQAQVSPTDFALKHPTERISYDQSGGHDQLAGDPSKRAFTYLVLTGGRFIYAAGLRMLVLKFILSMQASKDVLALASLEVGLGNIEKGSTVTMKWRGKPVFIKNRTEDEIADASSVNVSDLRDAQADADRCLKPEWLVLVGVCTHLGCVPLADAGEFGGWFCPCHGSHYDVSGRIRKGPAPYNMEVPEYKFLDDETLLIG